MIQCAGTSSWEICKLYATVSAAKKNDFYNHRGCPSCFTQNFEADSSEKYNVVGCTRRRGGKKTEKCFVQGSSVKGGDL